VVKITLKRGLPDTIEKKLVIAPNPASDNVEVTLKGLNTNSMLDVKIVNKFGEIVYQDKKSGPTFSLSVSGLKTDSYIITALDGTNRYTGMLMISH